jgi:hypothetical protein
MDKSTRSTQAKTADSAKAYWAKTKAATQAWFDKIGPPLNKMSNKLGAETFWPTPLDKESEKAARILRSFCIDGYEAEDTQGSSSHAAGKPADKKHGKHQIPREARHLPQPTAAQLTRSKGHPQRQRPRHLHRPPRRPALVRRRRQRHRRPQTPRRRLVPAVRDPDPHARLGLRRGRRHL